MAGINPPDFPTWMKETTRELARLGRVVARAGVPRGITSTARPFPGRLQPGTPLFETDTNRTVYVNADQSGFVDAMGNAV